jgi:DNA-binding SARP family transcriptional activator
MSKLSVEISLLGRFQVRVSEKRLGSGDIPGRKAPALLKLLALNRDRQLVRDQAMELLWPDLDGTNGAAQLYKALHQLRKAFAVGEAALDASNWIITTKNMVVLAPPAGVITDVGVFEQTARDALTSRQLKELERAAALYTGDLLPMDLYEPWTEVPRDHLRQLYVDVLLALAEGYQKRGDLAAAAETYRTVLEKDSALERAHRGLMAIFAQQGQRDRALKQYSVCVRALADELGVAPSRETRSLHAGIEEQTPSTGIAAIEWVPLHTPIQIPPLVNREAECQVIDGRLDQMLAKRGGVLLIEGPAGIGKTRLTRELVARAQRRGYSTLIGSGYEMEGAIAYGPFVEILQAALRDSAAGQELIPAEIASVMSGQAHGTRPVQNSDPRAAQTYLFAGIAEFLRQRAVSNPLVVILENCHAADQGTLEMFHFVGRRLQDVPLFLVATRRNDGTTTGDPLRKIIRSVGETVTADVLTLGPLSAADHHELLRQHGDQRSLTREHNNEVFRLSEGNPMYALELHEFRSQHSSPNPSRSQPVEMIPRSLSRNVAERLEKLSPSARQLLTIASVVGEGIPYPLLESLWSSANLAKEDTDVGLLDVLDQLIAAQLLHERGVHYHFRHELYRSCIYELASGARRRALHAQVARSLVQLGEREDELPVEQIAAHYRRAGDARQAAQFLKLAGQRAASMYAHDDALRRYREALELLEPAKDAVVKRVCGNLYTLIGDTSRAAGYLNDSLAAYARAISLIEDLSVSAAELTDLHCKTGLVAIFTTDMQRAGRHLAEAWRHVGNEPRMHARLHVLRALYLWHFNKLEEAAEYARRALDVAESAGATLEAAQACEILAMAYLPLGRWQEGLHYEQRRLQHGRWSPDLVVATDAHLCLWEYHVHDDHMLDRATTFMREVAAEANRLGDMRCVAICRYALGTIHLWQGETATALTQLDESLLLHDKVGSPAGMAYALARRAVLHTLENAYDLGWQSVQKGIEQAERASIRDHCLQRLYGVGIWNRMQAGDAKQVSDLVARSEALLDANGPCTACSLDLYPWLALYYLEHDNIDDVARCADRLEQLAGKTGNPVSEAFAAIVRCGAEQSRRETTRFDNARQRALDLMQGSVLRGSTSPMTYLFDRMAGTH